MLRFLYEQKAGVALIPIHIRCRWTPITTLATLLVTIACALPALAQSDETAKSFHVVPHLADGGGWQSSLLVTNVSPSTSPCTLQLHGLTVDRFEDAAGVTAAGSTATFALPASGGHLVWRTRNESAEASGYATLDCVSPVVAQVVFARIGSAGTPTGMATVFSSQTATVFQFPVLMPEASLGFAIANDTDAESSCRIVLEDPQQVTLDEAALSVPAKSHTAQFLNQAIQIPEDFSGGSATVSCDQQVAMIGLHFELRSDGSIVTFNALSPAVFDPSLRPSDETAKNFHVLPHIADGGGWQSFLLVTNASPSASACTLQLYGGLRVERFEAAAGVTAAGLTATFSLAASGGNLVWRTRNELAEDSGYATLDCVHPVVAQVVFARVGSAGTPTGMATVFSSQAWEAFQLPVLTPAGTLELAIANDAYSEASCRIVLEDPQGTRLGESTLSAPAKSNVAQMLDAAVPIPAGFRGGTARVECDQPVSVNGLHLELERDGGIVTFNTLPPAAIDVVRPGSVVSDRAALEALYELTAGPNWINNDNWLTDSPLGEWYGVGTDGNGRVTSLALHGNRLSGSIPPELGQLAYLERLDLGFRRDPTSQEFLHNGLWGSIPPELGSLVRLQSLHLQSNQLSGEIPPELGALTKLQRLSLQRNQLTGPIPRELGGLAELRRLDVYSNQLTGPIPPELGSLTKLQFLSLTTNGLTGGIPVELANLGTLSWLGLGSNELTGPIPPELGDLGNLEYLALWGNNLTGPIPPELGNLTKLDGLSLSGNELTGPIPPELGNLANLLSASFGNNRLTGSVPRSFLGLDSLQTLGCAQSDGVCLPATSEFREWVNEVEARSVGSFWVDVPWCDETEKLVLEALYNAMNGPGWTLSDGWLEAEDLARWYGVSTDSVTGRISGLDLTGNRLSGQLPDALGRLSNLKELRIGDNDLVGRLPIPLTEVRLQELDYRDTSLCVPDNAGFRAWLAGIPRHSGTGAECAPLTEREALEGLYRNTRGPNWSESGGWLTDAPLAEWKGVETNAAGQVVALRLRGRGLSGSLPDELGRLSELSELQELDLSYNRFSGSIPPGLASLGRLQALRLQSNQLSGEIPPELGRLSELQELNLSDNRFSGSIPPGLAGLGRLQELLVGGNQLSGGIPPELGRLSELRVLSLANSQLSGSIPPELGDLRRLEYLDLSRSRLTGAIPGQFGKLGELRILRLSENHLTGAIPSEVANLARLRRLDLSRNRLTGLIPSGLGELANLTELHLGDNQLAGPLLVELGRAGSLESLDLRSNALTGPIPPGYSNLSGLESVILAHNPGLAGPLPSGLAALGRLERFMAGGTGLCLPADSGLDAWFVAIADGYLARCREGPSVYLTQATQSWGHPVPLLAGQPALLRVFVTAPSGSAATMPDVTATFHVDGTERHTVRIPASAQIIPAEVVEGDLAASANAEIPAEVITPGLEMVIEVDPDGKLDSTLGVTKRIPESGRMPVEVRAVPPFQLTLIPFLWEGVADSSVVQSVNEMAEDASGQHEAFRRVRALLPVSELAVTAHEPVSMSHSDPHKLLAQIEAMRLMEGGSGYWMGVVERRPGAEVFWRPGYGQIGGRVSIAGPRAANTMAHELGHNLGLRHAPCGSPGGVDPWFPSSDGHIEAWGFDLERSVLVPPTTPDLMSYCGASNQWISGYHLSKALAHRLANDGVAAAALAAKTDPVRTILLWGGRDEDGVPYLDPAFVVDAAPSLPTAGGEYAIEGRTADGNSIFAFTFDMPVSVHAEGEATSFVFALPVQAGWDNALASVTLSGPGGSAALDENTDRPMAILRDPQTGRVRAFPRDPPPPAQSFRARSQVSPVPGLEVIRSRGMPDAAAWHR